MDKYYFFLLKFVIVFSLGLFIALSTAMASGVTSENKTGFADLDFGDDNEPFLAYPNRNYYDQEMWEYDRISLVLPAIIGLLLSLGLAASIYFTKSDLYMPTFITLIFLSIWGIITSLTCLIIPIQNVPTVKDTFTATIYEKDRQYEEEVTHNIRPSSIPKWFASAFIITIIVYSLTLIGLLVRRNKDIL